MDPKNKVAKEGKPQRLLVSTGAAWACCSFFMGRIEIVVCISVWRGLYTFSNHITYMIEKYNL